MTTTYRNGQFWIIDAVSGDLIETFPPFNTLAEAQTAVGSDWVDFTTADAIEFDL